MKFKILDTLRCTHQKILFKDFHVRRVLETYAFFQCLVNASRVFQTYDQIEANLDGDFRARIEFTIESDFKVQIETLPFQKNLEPIVLIPALYGQQSSGLGAGNFKTTDRHYWDQNRKAIDAYLSANQGIADPTQIDVIGINDQGFVTETSRFSLFFFDGMSFFTPSLQSGCLRGIFREHCLQSNGVELQGVRYPLYEKDFTLKELNGLRIFVGNSVRGLQKASFDDSKYLCG